MLIAEKIVQDRATFIAFKKAKIVRLDKLIGAASGLAKQKMIGACNKKKAAEIHCGNSIAQSSFIDLFQIRASLLPSVQVVHPVLPPPEAVHFKLLRY